MEDDPNLLLMKDNITILAKIKLFKLKTMQPKRIKLKTLSKNIQFTFLRFIPVKKRMKLCSKCDFPQHLEWCIIFPFSGLNLILLYSFAVLLLQKMSLMILIQPY